MLHVRYVHTLFSYKIEIFDEPNYMTPDRGTTVFVIIL